MQGIAAITAANGWAMALTGATIVITGLTVLSFIISQLHKIVEVLEKKEKNKNADNKTKSAATPAADPSLSQSDMLSDLAAAARIYKALTANIGERFSLATLYEQFAKENVPHPHITVRELRDAGYLSPVGEGKFSWKNV